MKMTSYISNEDHYSGVLLSALEAKKTLWIGTADLMASDNYIY